MEIYECTLSQPLQTLLKLICDIRAMEETVMELEFDFSKAPLGMYNFNINFILSVNFLSKISSFIGTL